MVWNRIDLKPLNKALIRVHFIMSIFPMTFHLDLSNARNFTKVELASSFCQTMPDDFFSYLIPFAELCSVASPMGWVLFGLKLLNEKFQLRVLQFVKDLLAALLAVYSSILLNPRNGAFKSQIIFPFILYA